jgi:shikimate dehydrogenase
MRKYGIIGFPLSHSFSKRYFQNKFKAENIRDAEFDIFPIENISSITDIINNNPELNGFSVTIPHKESIIPYLNEIDETAHKIGAVNCVKVTHKNNKSILKGYNTDCIGFEETLKPLLKPFHKKALILGTGGASKAVAYTLNKLAIEFQFVSRFKTNKTITYDQVDANCINEHLLIVNTTPLGMFPNINNYPLLKYELLSDKHYLYDLIYNPAETKFLEFGKLKNATVTNGEKMLHLQAEEAWRIWND